MKFKVMVLLVSPIPTQPLLPSFPSPPPALPVMSCPQHGFLVAMGPILPGPPASCPQSIFKAAPNPSSFSALHLISLTAPTTALNWLSILLPSAQFRSGLHKFWCNNYSFPPPLNIASLTGISSCVDATGHLLHLHKKNGEKCPLAEYDSIRRENIHNLGGGGWKSQRTSMPYQDVH